MCVCDVVVGMLMLMHMRFHMIIHYPSTHCMYTQLNMNMNKSSEISTSA